MMTTAKKFDPKIRWTIQTARLLGYTLKKDPIQHWNKRGDAREEPYYWLLYSPRGEFIDSYLDVLQAVEDLTIHMRAIYGIKYQPIN